MHINCKLTCKKKVCNSSSGAAFISFSNLISAHFECSHDGAQCLSIWVCWRQMPSLLGSYLLPDLNPLQFFHADTEPSFSAVAADRIWVWVFTTILGFDNLLLIFSELFDALEFRKPSPHVLNGISTILEKPLFCS